MPGLIRATVVTIQGRWAITLEYRRQEELSVPIHPCRSQRFVTYTRYCKEEGGGQPILPTRIRTYLVRFATRSKASSTHELTFPWERPWVLFAGEQYHGRALDA